MSPTLQGMYPLKRLAWDEAMLKLCGAPVPILHSLNTLPTFPSPTLPFPALSPFPSHPLPPLPSPPHPSPLPTHACRQWRRSQLSAHRRPLTARTCCSCSTHRAALGNQRAWSTLRPAISYMRHLHMKCVCVCVCVCVCPCVCVHE